MPNIDRRNEFCCRLPVTTLPFLAQRSRLGFSRYNCRVEIDLEELAEQARKGVVPILEHVLARGVSLYGSDGQGNIIEVAPDGRRYLVRVEGNSPVRVREIGEYHELLRAGGAICEGVLRARLQRRTGARAATDGCVDSSC